MNTLLIAWIMTCHTSNGHNYSPLCEYESRVFQYVTHYTTQTDQIVPYRSNLDKQCNEYPEYCRGFEAATKLGNLMRKRNKW